MAIPFVPPIVEIETWSPENFKTDIAATYATLHEDGWWARFLSNHDKPRQVSLYGNDKEYWKESAKMLATFLHTLPGTPFVYQGEEIGMTNIRLNSIKDYDDIDTINYYHVQLEEGKSEEEALVAAQNISRDNARTPMQWSEEENGGFSTHQPWLAVNPNYKTINVANQMKDQNSIFRYYQKLIALRKDEKGLIYGDLKMIAPEEGSIIAYTRTWEQETLVAVHNFSDRSQNLKHELLGRDKKLLLCNYEKVEIKDSEITLQPYETLLFKVK